MVTRNNIYTEILHYTNKLVANKANQQNSDPNSDLIK